MLQDNVKVKLINLHHDVTIHTCSIKGLEYVEQLVYNILDTLGVGPIYRLLFGLRLIDKSIWLSPNIRLQSLQPTINKYENDPAFELRMRYRPASFAKLTVLDRTAFNIIFAQIRYDFIHTRFTKERKDYILLNDSVLCLIVADLLRHAIENNIDVEDIFRRVDPKDFIPHKASNWQRALLFHLRKKLTLKDAVQIGYTKCDKDLFQIKQGFIETFLQDVCKDYCSEIYQVYRDDELESIRLIQVRIRYDQSEQDSSCIIECRPISRCFSKSSGDWTQLCDIYSICYGTFNKNSVEINRSNGVPFRIRFPSELLAKSFLSSIDGYYRLMRKWYFNFCRDVSSPHLDYLKQLKSHGPIGFQTMRQKMPKNRKAGTYLVRQCMENTNRYIIDVLLQSKERLLIDVDWNPNKKVFTYSGFAANKNNHQVEIILVKCEYDCLQNLINSIQIKEGQLNSSCPPLQLKHLIPPSEYDDCPALLLSMSEKKFAEFELSCQNRVQGTLTDLPKFIPAGMLQFNDSQILPSGDNKMLVRLAILNGEQNVIVKEHDNRFQGNCSFEENHGRKECILGSGHMGEMKFFRNLKSTQVRLVDWIFIKSEFFAETIGLEISNNSIIQEYFQLGQLDDYLAKNKPVGELTRKLIACQIANALVFLEGKRLIHGKIRCHNVFLKSTNPIQVKITDPLGTYDAIKDQAFIPPEYSGVKGFFNIPEYNHSIDVWALGTTFWQIYSHGICPPSNRYANTLVQPPECPETMWSIICSCWCIDPAVRATPQTVFRDLNDTSVWEREIHNYIYVTQENQDQSGDSLGNSTSSSIMSEFSTRMNKFISSGSTNTTDGSQAGLLATQKGPLAKIVNSTYLRAFIRGGPLASCTRRNSADPSNSDQSTWKSNESTDSFCPTETNLTKLTDLSDYSSSDLEFESSTWKIDSSKLKFWHEIGRGSCGVVIKGSLSLWGDLSEQVVAIKCLDSTESTDIFKLNDLQREFSILKSLNHENIIQTLGFVDETRKMLVVEYLPLGSLLSYLKNSQHSTDKQIELNFKKYAYDIAKGMEYLESMKIVHRDLALRNVLLKSETEAKICDFGLAQHIGPGNHYKLKTNRALPLRWYAPEALNTWTFTHKSDVWSYGIVLWEIYSGGNNPQYSGTYSDLPETLKHERLLMPEDCPEQMYRLMLSCWSYNPDDRESFSQIRERLEQITGGN